MHAFIRVALLAAAICAAGTPVFAQTDKPLEQGGGMLWGSLGFQGDLGGAVNSSGVGTVNGQRAEINTNTWSERYDAALIFRLGGAYNLSPNAQIIGTFNWEQSETDLGSVGLIGGQDLQAFFSDYQGWGFDGGYRYFFDTVYKAQPFVSASFGFQRIQNIAVNFRSTTFNIDEVPLYDDSWVATWRLGGGMLYPITDRFGVHVTIDIKYSGLLSDQAGIGTVGFERVNDVGNRWTLPILGGAYIKF